MESSCVALRNASKLSGRPGANHTVGNLPLFLNVCGLYIGRSFDSPFYASLPIAAIVFGFARLVLAAGQRAPIGLANV